MITPVPRRVNERVQRSRVLTRLRSRRSLTMTFGALLAVGGIANGIVFEIPASARSLDKMLAAEVETAGQQLDAFTGGAEVALRATARQADLTEAVRDTRTAPSVRSRAMAERVRENLIYMQGVAPLRLQTVTLYDLDGKPVLSTDRPIGERAPDPVAPMPRYLTDARWGSPGFVTISTPRRSSSGEWVLAVATPVADSAGRKIGILEAEAGLEGLRRSFGGRIYPTLLVNETRAAVDVDSRTHLASVATVGPSNVGPDAAVGTFAHTFAPAGVAGAKTVDGKRLSWRRLVDEGNENRWVLAVSDVKSQRPIDGLGPSTFGPLVTGLALLLIAALGARSERDRLEQAMTDELTGLPSRRLLKDRLEQAVLNAKRDGPKAEVGLLVLDLDRFKEVNDTLGHSLGDRLLAEVAQRLRATLRENDTIARLGGDEFAVVVSHDDPSGDVQVAEKLLRAFAQPVALDGLLLTVGASIGIARFPADGDDPERLLRCADVAMYHSKRNRLPWVRYAIESDPSDPARLELLSDLRAAIGTPQLELHYQPKVNLATDEVMGVEALLRWTHPAKGPIPPDTFISIAEQTGVMAPLTDDVLRKAAHQLKTWMRDGRDLSVAVNISASNLTEGEFVERVRRIIAEEDVPAEFIVLELTESAVMSDHRRGLEVLNELSAIGFRLSIDDFGTGYSSLSYLQRLPVDELKIDRSFVKTLMDDQVNRSIVRSTVDLGHNLGLSVVAEGVEDEATLRALAELGCDVAQGYFVSRPLPAAALVTWLDSRRAATTVLSDDSATLQLP
jgi:diguanylate cyclase (GGDEF)-like protein